jgi:hypothetical protein
MLSQKKKIDIGIKLAIIIFALLATISLLTNYHGSTDVGDYADVAKFFAGDYSAKIRTSHSVFFGLIHSPLLKIFKTFTILKIANLFWLALIAISLYFISGKDKRALILFLISPVVWFMGPWINPIQLATLFFLWGYFFIDNFDKTKECKYILYAGILFGLSWSTWTTVIVPIFLIAITFFFNRNVNYFVLFIISILIGILPLFIIDYVLYSFPFYSLIKSFSANLIVVTFLGDKNIYGVNTIANSFIDLLVVIISLPAFIYMLYHKNFFINKKRQITFLTLGVLFFLVVNPQIRYILLLWPIIILYLSKVLDKKKFRIQVMIFLVVSLLITLPYAIQIKYSTNSPDITGIFNNFGDWTVSSKNEDKLMLEDLEKISQTYPNEVFVVGNENDNYAVLASLYWGEGIGELVSIEDYTLAMNNETIIFKKIISSKPSIRDRRQIWVGGGIGKNENDLTDYELIDYGISIGEPLKLKNFAVVNKYNVLYLNKKIL